MTKFGIMRRTTAASQWSVQPYGLLLSFLLFVTFSSVSLSQPIFVPPDIVSMISAAHPSPRAAAICYFPAGNPAPYATECIHDYTGDGTGLCCNTGDSCFGNKLCGYIPSDNGGKWSYYRGACTDKTGKAEYCADYCITDTPNSIRDYYCTVSPCIDIKDHQTCDYTEEADYSTPEVCKGRSNDWYMPEYGIAGGRSASSRTSKKPLGTTITKTVPKATTIVTLSRSNTATAPAATATASVVSTTGAVGTGFYTDAPPSTTPTEALPTGAPPAGAPAGGTVQDTDDGHVIPIAVGTTVGVLIFFAIVTMVLFYVRKRRRDAPIRAETPPPFGSHAVNF
ncbi:hypothetical protein B0H67DRAFT_557046 [Lasiosphaeris hirsuta]|uniref:Uncharacterized protein n=1 Tax=Lasiosphaeris hirsuta TaxID=260670 RepID=A0AA40A3H7_9PEZI|nr:hypothetical protein B0H67DRAFT_557046 [Lasiosphaeris hirsuta]